MGEEKGLPVRVVNPMAANLPENDRSEEDPRKKLRWALAVVLSVAAFFGVMLGFGSRSVETASAETNAPDPRSVFVHLFEWTWKDIERECVDFLGPNGFSAVQVSPVNEHIDHRKMGDRGFPWWTRYQPVSYKIESRSGTREEFRQMIATCKSVGVDIYVDILLNHMARDNTGTGIAGTPYNSNTLEYSVYSAQDFNHCDPPEIQGSDYSNNPDRVRRCRLVDLPDLNHDSAYVRGKLIEHMQDLVDLGVGGFRLDAGKHMYVHDVNNILAGVEGDFYVFSEIIDFGYDAISVKEYTPYYDATEFRYEQSMANIFPNGKIADLNGIGENWGYIGTTQAVVFTDNHDTQRHGHLNYKHGQIYELANVFLLTWPYGYPKIMSSYDFSYSDQGPPSDEFGNTRSVFNADGSDNCGAEWICEHRNKAHLVKFRNYMLGQKAYYASNWWSNGFQAIAFSRHGENGVAGYVIINKEGFALNNFVFFTGLRDGVYCNLGRGGKFENGVCTGDQLVVKDGGYMQMTVPAMSAVILQTNAKL